MATSIHSSHKNPSPSFDSFSHQLVDAVKNGRVEAITDETFNALSGDSSFGVSDRYCVLATAVTLCKVFPQVVEIITDERLQNLTEDELIRLFSLSLKESSYREVVTDERLNFLLADDQKRLLLEAARLKEFDFITEKRIDALPEEESGFYEELCPSGSYGNLRTAFFCEVDRAIFAELSEKHRFLLLRTMIHRGEREAVEQIIQDHFDSFSEEIKFSLMQEDLERKTPIFTTAKRIHQLKKEHQNVLFALAHTKGHTAQETCCTIL